MVGYSGAEVFVFVHISAVIIILLPRLKLYVFVDRSVLTETHSFGCIVSQQPYQSWYHHDSNLSKYLWFTSYFVTNIIELPFSDDYITSLAHTFQSNVTQVLDSMMLLWSLAVILVCLVSLGASVLNADFEDPLGYDNWYCAGCEADNDLDAYSGNYSMLSVNRYNHKLTVSLWV